MRQPFVPTWRWRVTAVFAVAGFAALYCLRLGYPYADPDLFGYLAFARLWDQTGVFPRRDVFAYTPVKPLWVYHEWLTGVLYYAVVKVAGFGGLKALKLALGLGTAAAVYGASRLRRASVLASLVCLFIVSPVFSFGFASLRAQALTNALFAVLLGLLEWSRVCRRPWLLALTPPLFVFWGNAHGGFVVGLCLLGLYALACWREPRQALPYVLAGLASLAATTVNPYGLDYWIYLAKALAMPRPDIDEWLSVPRALALGHQAANTAAFLLTVVVALLFFRRRNESDAAPLLVLASTAAMGFWHLRHQVFFFLAVAVYLPWHLDCYWARLGERRPDVAGRWRKLAGPGLPLLAVAMTAYFGAACLEDGKLLALSPARASDGNLLTAPYQPVEAVAFMREQGLSGKVLTEFEWGEYLAWELSPSVNVAFDGRYETVYQDDFSKEFFALLQSEDGIARFLAKYPPDYVLARSYLPLDHALGRLDGWVELRRDLGSVLYGRGSR